MSQKTAAAEVSFPPQADLMTRFYYTLVSLACVLLFVLFMYSSLDHDSKVWYLVFIPPFLCAVQFIELLDGKQPKAILFHMAVMVLNMFLALLTLFTVARF